MSLLKIVAITLLQICRIQSEDTDLINEYETQAEKYLDNKYFIIVDKDNAESVTEEEEDITHKNKQGKYYIIVDKGFNPVERRFRDLKKVKQEIRNAELVKSQHTRKMKEISEFMKANYLTTNYLYEEVQRIKREKQVKDELRQMVDYLQRPEKGAMKSKVLKCYYKARRDEVIPIDEWGQNTNNLVLNIGKDPYNHGFIN